MMRYVLLILAVLSLLTSCSLRRVGQKEAGPQETPSAQPFDPLATTADREVVPAAHPVRPGTTAAGDSLVSVADLNYREFDSSSSLTTPTDVYRVQIFTSRLYNEASREMTIAEEIFNLPIYLDYEVPYYKLRVGDFATRDAAEDMVPEIKDIGYRNAWVARVVLRVRDIPGTDISEEPILPEMPEDSAAVDSAYQQSGSEDR